MKLKALTLIELLIVISIISVLSAVVIAVVNPVTQRERGYDGTIIATANKIVTAITAYQSAKGEYPDCDVLAMRDLQSAVVLQDCSTLSVPESGQFEITGITTPKQCTATERYLISADPADDESCGFQYLKNTDGDVCMGIKLHRPTDLNGDGIANTYLFWSSIINRIEDDPNPCCVSAPGNNWGEIVAPSTERCVL